MKKKSPRGIPDFSRQGTPAKNKGPADTAAPSKPAPRAGSQAPRAKPQATSSKSGQRGK